MLKTKSRPETKSRTRIVGFLCKIYPPLRSRNENMEDDREEAKRRRGHRKSMYKCVDLHKRTRQQNYETETINKD